MSSDTLGLIRSGCPGIAWPAVPPADAAQALAFQFQLELSQWYSPERLRELQYRQLDILLRHAYATVPYYRERWSGLYDPAVPLTPERFSRLPVLTRGSLQQNFEALKSTAPPAEHGPPRAVRSSGSTGTPVRVLKTPLTDLMWQNALLREGLWHRRDFTGKVAAIRHGVPPGETPGWGPAMAAVFEAGRMAQLPVSASVEVQLRWLEEQQPDYVQTFPSNLAELARLALARGARLTRLREAWTVGEVVTPELRTLCREAWGVKVVDAYTTEEVGYLGLQCPDHEHYHVQSEFAAVEVIDTRGKACQPGHVGPVVVTPLHNFAMPLVRYVLGDYAEAGGQCACGRGLPVLSRIMGRVRNMLVTAAGQLYWPSFGTRRITEIAPVLQHQLVQKDLDLIEVRLVTARALTSEEEQAVRQRIQSRLPVPFEVRFVYVSEIPRSASGKFEDFMSEVAVPGANLPGGSPP